MRIYRCEDFDSSDFYGYEVRKKVSIEGEELKTVLDACNNDGETLKNWINIVGVECTNVIMLNESAIYEVDGKYLNLSQLSSGESLLLYIIACKQSNKKLLIHGLFERLGHKLKNVVGDIVIDYENLVVVLYTSGPTVRLSKLIVEV